MELVDLIENLFKNFEFLEKHMQLWLVAGKFVGLIGAYIYIFRKFAAKMFSGDAFNLEDFAYPIFIAFLLSIYTPMAKGIPELFGVSIFGTGGSEETIKYTKKLGEANKKSLKHEKEMEANSVKLNQQTVDEANKFVMASTSDTDENYQKDLDQTSNTLDLVFNPQRYISDIIYSVLGFVIGLISQLCMAILFTVSKLYLIFLYIFGPFSIGMSLIPGFESSITNWLQNMIKYSLWVPVGNTVAQFCSDALVTVKSDDMVVLATGGTAALFVAIFMLVGFLAVPKIVGNIISASGGGQSATKGMAVQAARMLITKGL